MSAMISQQQRNCSMFQKHSKKNMERSLSFSNKLKRSTNYSLVYKNSKALAPKQQKFFSAILLQFCTVPKVRSSDSPASSSYCPRYSTNSSRLTSTCLLSFPIPSACRSFTVTKPPSSSLSPISTAYAAPELFACFI